GQDITVTVEGFSLQKGSVTASSATDKTYGNWSPPIGLFRDGGTLIFPEGLVSNGSGSVTQIRPNAPGPHSQFNCTLASAAELAADHCMPKAKNLVPVETKGKVVMMKNGETYTLTVTDNTAGDFVYEVKAQVTGLFCKAMALTSISCSAVVADAIADQA